MIKIFVNGHWIGSIDDPILFTETFKNYRRISLIPVQTSISWNIQANIIYINTDGGRLCRPIFYIDSDRNPSYDKYSDNLSWSNLLTGSHKKPDNFDINTLPAELYDDRNIDSLFSKKALLDFIDSEEAETSISVNKQDSYINNRYTHCEIHPRLY